MRDPDEDVDYGGGGDYTEIDRPSRLAFTWIWDDETRRTLIEIDFEEADGGARRSASPTAACGTRRPCAPTSAAGATCSTTSAAPWSDESRAPAASHLT